MSINSCQQVKSQNAMPSKSTKVFFPIEPLNTRRPGKSGKQWLHLLHDRVNDRGMNGCCEQSIGLITSAPPIANATLVATSPSMFQPVDPCYPFKIEDRLKVPTRLFVSRFFIVLETLRVD